MRVPCLRKPLRGVAAVAAVLDAPRETPADALSAVLTLLDLREYAAAGESTQTCD